MAELSDVAITHRAQRCRCPRVLSEVNIQLRPQRPQRASIASGRMRGNAPKRKALSDPQVYRARFCCANVEITSRKLLA